MYNKQQEENNSVNTKKQKNISFYAIVIMLVLVIVASSAVGIFAWAKYITSTNGASTAQVAKWSFNVNLKAGDKTVTLGSESINLATTKYNHVADERLAPGTSGEFQVIIDTTGTEVSLVYDVNISLANCPRNITFSRKAHGETTATEISAGGAENGLTRTLSFSEYVAVSPTNDNGVYTETIYWDWPYELETGTDEEKTAYDDRDNADSGMTTEMIITVTGTEVLKNTLAGKTVEELAKAGEIQRWESINYDPGDKSISSSDLTLAGASLIGDTKVASISGATLNGTINANSASDWVVLDVTDDGDVLIMPRTYSSTTLRLEGMDGYNNAIPAMNQVAGIYKNNEYAESARSLTVEDVNKVEGYTPNGDNSSYTWSHRYSMDDNLNIVDNGTHKEIVTEYVPVYVPGYNEYGEYGEYEEEVIYEEQQVEKDVDNKVNATYKSTSETGFYSYNLSNFIKTTSNSNQYCWLASRCVDPYSGGCSFYMRLLLRDGRVGSGNYLFSVRSRGSAHSYYNSYPVVPVVTLKSTVQMEKVNDVWQLSL